MKNHLSLIALFITGIICVAFVVKDKEIKKLPKSIQDQYAFVSEGLVILDCDTNSVRSFFISKYEVSNFQYREFIFDLKSSNKNSLAVEAQIDTMAWASESYSFGAYESLYYWHPAYENYPVVNVSLEGAKLYCDWLSKKLNSFNTEKKYEVSLPSRKEWVRASRPDYLAIPYSWGGPFIRNKKGQLLCNFKRIGEENIRYDSSKDAITVEPPFGVRCMSNNWSNEFDITCPVQAYCSSNIGLYNMNGNVSELTSDGFACGGSWNSTGYDVRNESVYDYTKPSPYVGFRPIITVVE